MDHNIKILSENIKFLRDKLDLYQRSFDELEKKHLGLKFSIITSFILMVIFYLLSLLFFSGAIILKLISVEKVVRIIFNESVYEYNELYQLIEYQMNVLVIVFFILSICMLLLGLFERSSVKKSRLLLYQRGIMKNIVTYFNDSIAGSIDLAKIIIENTNSKAELNTDKIIFIKNWFSSRVKTKYLVIALYIFSIIPPIVGQILAIIGSIYLGKYPEFKSRMKTVRWMSSISEVFWIVIIS